MENSLKAQLEQEERELKAELEGVVKSKKRATKSKKSADVPLES